MKWTQEKMDAMGKFCQDFRVSKGATQKEVADDLGCTVCNISAFENGRNRSGQLLWWYLENGMKFKDLRNALKDK